MHWLTSMRHNRLMNICLLFALVDYRHLITYNFFILLTSVAKDLPAGIEMKKNAAYETHKLPHSHPQPAELQPCAAYGVFQVV